MVFNMHKLKNFGSKIKTKILSWSLKKKIIYGAIALLVVFLVVNSLRPEDNSANTTTDTAKILDMRRTVLATGQVTSTTELDLSFYKGGIVRSLKAKVGDKVKEGQILATLEQGSEVAALTSAKGAVAAAEARYKKIIEGATTDEVRLAEVALSNAEHEYNRVKSQQDLLVTNALRKVMNSTPEARPTYGSQDYTPPTIGGNYSKTIEGDIIISTYQSGNGPSFNVSGISTGGGTVTTTTPQPIGDTGLTISFPGVDTNVVKEWTISIPNKNASDYITNLNAYEAALKTRDSALGTAQALIDQRKVELDIKKSAARPSDIELAEADILSAKGQLQSAQANYEHTVLRAPTSGTITKVNIKLGELAVAQQQAMVLENIEDLYIEANINEANIESITEGAQVDLTFDAFGTDNIFKGRILKVDPSSTLVSGVVNYKVTASIESAPDLKPGMTANMTILVSEKSQVLSVPSRSILTDKTGKRTIRLVTNTKTKAFKEVEITTGLEGDGGLTEITSGLQVNDEIVVLIKND